MCVCGARACDAALCCALQLAAADTTVMPSQTACTWQRQQQLLVSWGVVSVQSATCGILVRLTGVQAT